MKITETIDSHYPTMVMTRNHSGLERLNDDLKSVVFKLEQQYSNTKDNAATNGDSTTHGGFQTAAKLSFFDLDETSVKEFKGAIILPAIERYLDKVLKCDPFFTPFTVVGWANVLRKGHWQAPHMHPKEYNIISGVYYVDVPEQEEPAGDLDFVNPHPISVMAGAQSMTRSHTPESGQLLLFPPYYMHYVHPMISDDPRVVVAFDVRLETPA